MRDETITATRDMLDDVLLWMEDMVEPLGCPKRVLVQLHVCVEELYVNVCNYAYKPGPGQVRVIMDAHPAEGDKPAWFEMTLIDQGVPFNPVEHADPDINAELSDRPVGGLGIHMVRKRMDAFTYEYRDGSNVTHIEKRLTLD